jgi:hypothetical protein
VEVQGLASGAKVLVTEAVSPDGSITVTIGPPAGGSVSGSGSRDGQGQDSDDAGRADVTGSITRISSGSITIATAQAGPMTFAVDPGSSLTDGFILGDVVDVTYSAESGGGREAEDVEYVENDAIGIVTLVSAAALTMTDETTGQPDRFAADPSLLLFDGVLIGNEIDVSYHLNGDRMVVDGVDNITADNARQ